MARPRTVTDEAILAATRRAIAEQGPRVPLSVIARDVGISAAAIVQRMGSKERLLFAALRPAAEPRYLERLATPPGGDPRSELTGILVELADSFVHVAPSLAALRTSGIDLDAVFASESPPVATRRLLAEWLAAVPLTAPEALAELLVGASEARGWLTWLGPPMLAESDSRAWAQRLVGRVFSREGQTASREAVEICRGTPSAGVAGTSPLEERGG